jgi:hypothetical protein
VSKSVLICFAHYFSTWIDIRKHTSFDAQRHLPQTLFAASYIFNPPARAAIRVAIKPPYLLHSSIIINSSLCNNSPHCQPSPRVIDRSNTHLHLYFGVNLSAAADSCASCNQHTHTHWSHLRLLILLNQLLHKYGII